jgi:hypothetical protein
VVQLKAVELANLTHPTMTEVIDQAYLGINHVRRSPHLPSLFLRHAGLTVSWHVKPTPKALVGLAQSGVLVRCCGACAALVPAGPGRDGRQRGPAGGR